MIQSKALVKIRFKVVSSVADPGCTARIADHVFLSIQDPTKATKEKGEK
jgi:hypothetical protein